MRPVAHEQGAPAVWVDVLQITYRVGRTMFETAGLPEHLVKHCNAMDEVWVPTAFNRETFISAGVHLACC
jgi:hypothetical protein